MTQQNKIQKSITITDNEVYVIDKDQVQSVAEKLKWKISIWITFFNSTSLALLSIFYYYNLEKNTPKIFEIIGVFFVVFLLCFFILYFVAFKRILSILQKEINFVLLISRKDFLIKNGKISMNEKYLLEKPFKSDEVNQSIIDLDKSVLPGINKPEDEEKMPAISGKQPFV